MKIKTAKNIEIETQSKTHGRYILRRVASYPDRITLSINSNTIALPSDLKEAMEIIDAYLFLINQKEENFNMIEDRPNDVWRTENE